MTQLFYNYTLTSLWFTAFLIVSIFAVVLLFFIASLVIYIIFSLKDHYQEMRKQSIQLKAKVDKYEEYVTKESRK